MTSVSRLKLLSVYIYLYNLFCKTVYVRVNEVVVVVVSAPAVAVVVVVLINVSEFQFINRSHLIQHLTTEQENFTFSIWFDTKFSMETTFRGVPWGTSSSARPMNRHVWPSNENLLSFASFVVKHDLEISNWNHLGVFRFVRYKTGETV